MDVGKLRVCARIHLRYGMFVRINCSPAMYGYSEELVCFHLELKTEYEKFQGVCDHLLRDVVDPSVIDNLLQPESEESGKSDWKTHILENVLQEKYRKTAVPVIMQNMKRLLDALQSLKEMFPVNPSSKVSRYLSTRKRNHIH